MPPDLRNHRVPTGIDTPTAAAASSLESPAAIPAQNAARSSRRATGGLPGDRNVFRVDRAERRVPVVIAASIARVLRRPIESTQYTSEQFQRLLADNGITCSMSRAGNVRDNSAMESFFSSLKTERTARKVYRTRDEARADVFDYIERFYNPRRRHSKLGCLSPIEFEVRAMPA
jgi:putative transposase